MHNPWSKSLGHRLKQTTRLQIVEISKKYNKTPAQITLCYLVTRGISVVPKSTNSKRIEENFDVLFELDSMDFGRIDRLMGNEGELGVRTLEMTEYLGFDNFNEQFEEP